MGAGLLVWAAKAHDNRVIQFPKADFMLFRKDSLILDIFLFLTLCRGHDTQPQTMHYNWKTHSTNEHVTSILVSHSKMFFIASVLHSPKNQWKKSMKLNQNSNGAHLLKVSCQSRYHWDSNNAVSFPNTLNISNDSVLMAENSIKRKTRRSLMISIFKPPWWTIYFSSTKW